MTFGFEPPSEGREVVDLAIEDSPDAVILIGEWLTAAGEINDGQSPKTQGSPVVTILPRIIRPSMHDPIHHGRESFRRQ